MKRFGRAKNPEVEKLKDTIRTIKEKKDWKEISIVAKQLNQKYSLIAEYEDAIDIAKEKLGEKEISLLEATLAGVNASEMVRAANAIEAAEAEVETAKEILRIKINMLKEAEILLRVAEKRAARSFPEIFNFL